MNLIDNSRNSTLDILKAVGIITMVMGHSNMGSFFEIYISGFHMQLFFILSGYLYKPDKYPDFFALLKRKTETILVPYFFFAIVTILICELVNFFCRQDIYIWQQYLWGIIWSNQSVFPITGAIWFLQCIFWVCIFYYFIDRLKSPMISSLIVFLILGCSLLLNQCNLSLPFSIDSALSGIVFYHIGYLLAKHKIIRKYQILYEPTLFWWICAFIGNVALIYLNRTVNPRTCQYSIFPLYYLNALTGTWVWFIVSQFFEKWTFTIKNYLISDVLRFIGFNSIVFLGFNQLIIKGLYLGLSQLLPVELALIRAGRNIIICTLTLLVCTLLTIIISKSPFCVLIGKKELA